MFDFNAELHEMVEQQKEEANQAIIKMEEMRHAFKTL